MPNKKKRSRKQSGHPNVTWHKRRRAWYGRFVRCGVMRHVGYWPENQLDKAIYVTEAVVKEYDKMADRAQTKRELLMEAEAA